MDQGWDVRGEAAAALAHVVQGFGVPVLGQADLLEGLLNDDVPQLPREVAMLTEAARQGIAAALAERVRQGVSAQAAVSMVVTDLTSRTAVDAVGARWAATLFARAAGYDIASVGATKVASDPAALEPSQPGMPPVSDVTGAAPPTRQLDRGPAFTPRAAVPVEDPTILPEAPEPTGPPVSPGIQENAGPQFGPGPQQPFGAQAPLGAPAQFGAPQFGAPQFGAAQFGGPAPFGATTAPAPSGSHGLAVLAGLATSLAVLMSLAWGVLSRSDAGAAVFWLSSLVLVAGGIGVAIWAGTDRLGAGLAAVAGLAIPGISWGIYNAYFATTLTFLSTAKRSLLELTSWVTVLGALTAASVAISALRRRKLLARQVGDPIVAIVAIVGVLFPLTNILPQISFDGAGTGNVLGHDVTGWRILWGLIFLVVFALPPVLAAFLPAGSRLQLGVLTGWLVIVFAWQLSDSPTDGYKAAAGLYLGWIVWLLVLVGTIALAARGPQPPQTAPAAEPALNQPR
jgi:hypothetical protein